MRAMRCRNESEGFTLVQEVFIGYPTVAQERKSTGVSLSRTVTSQYRKLLKVARTADFCGTGVGASVSVNGVGKRASGSEDWAYGVVV